MYIHVSEFVNMKLIFKEEIMNLWGYRRSWGGKKRGSSDVYTVLINEVIKKYIY